jgi:benzoate-CoA ligase family protein
MSASGNLAGWMLDQFAAEQWHDRVALRQGDRTCSYGQFADMVLRVSDVLRGIGVTRGERVALFMRDTVEAAASILGVIHAGGVAVPLSELMTAVDVKRFLVHSGAGTAIVEARLEPVLDEIRAEVSSLREILCVGLGDRPASERGERDFFAAVARATPAQGAISVAPTDAAMLLYSAGFAAEDLRAVPHSKHTIAAAFESSGRGLFGLCTTDCVLSVARLSTAYGLGSGLLFPLLAGAQAILFPEQPRSKDLFRQIEESKPTVLFATPSVYSQLAADVALTNGKPLASLRLAVAGAEGMPERLIPKIRAELGTEVMIGYGLTEMFQFALAGRSDDPVSVARVFGRTVQGVRARVIDEDGDVVEANEIGTLQLAAPSMFVGYWPSSLASGDIDSEGWFTTHDRFLIDERGDFHHCGRIDDLFKVGGKWVSPVEVERALTGHEAVWECAVIGAEDEEGLVKPLAFVVTNVGHQGGPALENELQEYVKTVLAPYKYPRWIDFVDALPRGPGGKILRYKLKPARRRRRAETGHG